MKNRSEYTFTSESVGAGHPDKICDQISDAMLDKALTLDAESRVACEAYASTGMVVVGGEITTDCYIDVVQTVRDVLKEIGYNKAEYGINYQNCAVLSVIKPQSPDIAMGVDSSITHEQGAGDQGIMFGYATKETANFMPAPLDFSHAMMRTADELRKSGNAPFLRPDCKGQVTVSYRDGMPAHIDTVVLSHQHDEEITHQELQNFLIDNVIKKALPASLLSDKTHYLVNPTGRFVVGGPQGDVGLTGRKIIVDTYGGAAAHGGGAFSGKDPSKVDRSAAYMARYIAKNLVASGVADKLEIELAYAIGMAEPLSVYVNSFGTAQVDEARIEQVIRDIFPLKPAAIIAHLNLKRPIYAPTAAYGHFGRNIFPWEVLDMVATLKALW